MSGPRSATATPRPALRFRKKPLEIEALRVRDAFERIEHDTSQLPDWFNDAYDRGNIWFRHPTKIELHTPEGVMSASIDDWIIRGACQELYLCRADFFGATYERVE